MRQARRPKCLFGSSARATFSPASLKPTLTTASSVFLPHSQCICPDTRQVWTCPKALCTHAHTHTQKERGGNTLKDAQVGHKYQSTGEALIRLWRREDREKRTHRRTHRHAHTPSHQPVQESRMKTMSGLVGWWRWRWDGGGGETMGVIVVYKNSIHCAFLGREKNNKV